MGKLEEYFLYAIFCILVSTILLLTLTRQQKQRLFAHIPILDRGDPTSTSVTPPRSLTPEKRVPTNTPPSTDYRHTFPPSTREALITLAESLSPERKKRISDLKVDEVEFKNGVIPFLANYKECGPSTYTPTEVSIEEVKALGDFPDYSKLSGVPLPEPYDKFAIETALPRPYRPFRWAYHQTMSLTKLEPDWWLELESNYASRIAERVSLFEKHGKMVLDYLPGTELACKEIMEMALQFICARYPQYFSLCCSPEKGYVFNNEILNTTTVINSMHPLHVILHNIPEDFAIMLRNPEDGYYYFRAGLLCSALGWNVSTKLGMQLKEIHSPIPDYKEKMEFSMDRYFAKLPTARPIQRGSWGLEVDKPLFMPPGDPHENYRSIQSSDLPLSRIHLRVDWQTLRRLPLSGAIIFNFKAVFTQIEEFRREKYIPALLNKILHEGKKEIMEYKNTWHVEHVVLPNLKVWEEEQVKEGLVEKDWKVTTLEESPWFPGWEEKWHRQQGF